MGDLPVLVGGLGRSCFLGGLGCLGGPNFVGGALDPCRSPACISLLKGQGLGYGVHLISPGNLVGENSVDCPLRKIL